MAHDALARLTIRTAEADDWPAMARLASIGFGSRRSEETMANWRTMVSRDGAVIACDGPDVVGQVLFLDLQLTVPGGAVLPMAGVTWVVVAPTHRRRGVLTRLFEETHRRMVRAKYPIAGLEASEYGIYGRFGYGPATVEQTLTVDRRTARLHADVPDPRGVRIVSPAEHRSQIEALYERWRLRTPGGLHTPEALWDEVFADRDAARGGGSELMALLHDDGFVTYRIYSGDETASVRVFAVVALTSRAYVALWRVLLGMDLKDTITVSTPLDDTLPYLLTDARLARVTGTADALWLRILDVPTVLEARTYAADVDAVLQLTDDVLAGGGRYALQVRNGRARCTPSDAEPDVVADLSVLGSLYLGTHRASSYAAANRLRANDTRLVTQLDAAFASEVPAQLGYGF